MLKKIYFHPLFFLASFLCFMTGFFKPFLYLSLLLCIHECGHILTGLYFHWNIKRIVILPFGGLTVFEESLNRPMKEEFLITMMGPLFQIVAYLLLKSHIDYDYFKTLNDTFLLFNLLPIYPLDGSKIVLLLLERYFPFYQSYQYLFTISFVFCFICILLSPYNFLLFFFVIFLFKKVIEEWHNLKATFSKFLLERYLNQYHFHKYIKLKDFNLKKMRRDKMHLFYFQKTWVTEKHILKKWFDK